MGSKNLKTEGKISFKLSEEKSRKIKDHTKETLALLAKLDNIAKIDTSQIVDQNFAKKRQKKGAVEEKNKSDEASLLFTEEEIESMSKQYFIHSKSKAKKRRLDELKNNKLSLSFL